MKNPASIMSVIACILITWCGLELSAIRRSLSVSPSKVEVQRVYVTNPTEHVHIVGEVETRISSLQEPVSVRVENRLPIEVDVKNNFPVEVKIIR